MDPPSSSQHAKVTIPQHQPLFIQYMVWLACPSEVGEGVLDRVGAPVCGEVGGGEEVGESDVRELGELWGRRVAVREVWERQVGVREVGEKWV